MLRYDPTVALIIVDVQNDFADPEGSLYVREGEETVPFINAEIRKAREAGALVVFTQDWHPESTPHFEKDGGIWPVHCVGGTWGAELHPDLDTSEDDPRIQKGVGGEDGYSGFTVADPESGEKTPTDLGRLFDERGIRGAVIVGLATDYCVKSTALDAVERGLDTMVLHEGIRAVDLEEGDGERAIEEMTGAGARIA